MGLLHPSSFFYNLKLCGQNTEDSKMKTLSIGIYAMNFSKLIKTSRMASLASYTDTDCHESYSFQASIHRR